MSGYVLIGDKGDATLLFVDESVLRAVVNLMFNDDLDGFAW